MTIGADGRAGISASDSFGMNTLLIRQEWPITDAASLHDRLVAVTLAAGLSNVRAVDRRLRICGWEERSQIAVSRVAIQTLCTLRPILF